MNENNDFTEYLNNSVAFTSKRLLDLFLLINEQADIVYKKIGIEFPVLVSSTVLFLSRNEKGTLTEISKGLGLSHQLVAQRIKILLKMELIEKRPLKSDKRKTNYELTEKGKKQSEILHLYCKGAEIAFNSLSQDVGVDLHTVIDNAIHSLIKKSFSERYESDENLTEPK